MHVMESAPGTETVIDGRPYLYFCGTGYLGLHGHNDLVAAACDALHQYGLGTATTRAGFGNAPPVVDVERQAAEFCHCEDAFYFASGYVGNHVLLSAVAPAADLVLIDQCAHYSVVDASRYFGLPTWRFAHADPQSLREMLRQHVRAGQVPLVLSDGVFAARGTIAPVIDFLNELQPYPGAMLCLDDCHGFGVLGEGGNGTYEHFGVFSQLINAHSASHAGQRPPSPAMYAVSTLSKSFGAYGGIIWGARTFIDSVKTMSHYFQGASAPPTPAAAAGAAALRLVKNNPDLIQRVQHNARYLKQRLADLGLQVDRSPVPIISLELGDAMRMQSIQQKLADDGILIAYMSQYSGLAAAGALRIAVFATHTDHMLDRLTEALGRHL